MPHLRRSIVETVYRAADITFLNSALARATRDSLKILAYHAVCSDEVRHEPWIPPYFVSLSEFESQLAVLRERYRVVRLSDALEYARKHGRFEPHSVALTFDDGYANNISLALPVLERYGFPATIFLATHWMGEKELFPHDRALLLGMREFKNMPIRKLLQQLKGSSNREACFSDVQRAVLQPLTWREIESGTGGLIEFGAHTHHHAILSNESPPEREAEITRSIELIREHTGIQNPLFSYPNGQPGDFGPEDERVLKSCGCRGAVSTTQGWNEAKDDFYALKRIPVSLHHSGPAFRAEVSGLRTMVTRPH